MPKKYMNDFERVQAGNWLEDQKGWIATDPSMQMIADTATRELGHRVTTAFVKSYLNATTWFAEIRKKVEPAPPAAIHRAVAITIEVLEEIIEQVEPTRADEIRASVEQAKTILGTAKPKTLKSGRPEPLLDDLMLTGHA
jgi:hypothetical protein